MTVSSPTALNQSRVERICQKLHLSKYMSSRKPRLSRGPLHLDSDSESDVENDGHALSRAGPSSSQPKLSHRVAKVCSRKIHSWYSKTCQFFSSETGKGVLKCSLAYLLGSMATFIEPVAWWIGSGQDTKHTVATLTVYFHPARTQGSMYKASLCAVLAFAYATMINISSMAVSMFFAETLHMLALGHVVVLIVLCGGGLGFVGWVKQRLADPLVNTACSLASLAMITVLTKEGDVQQGELSFAPIVRVLKMLFLGVTITVVICLAICPQSARVKLRESIAQLTDSLSDMLAIITEGYTLANADLLEQETFVSASRRNKSAYSQVDKLLKEAKFEHYLAGTERQYRLEKNLVRCVQDLTQSVGGLRSAASLQFDLLKQAESPAAFEYQRPIVPLPTNHRSKYYNGQIIQPLFTPVSGSPQGPLRVIEHVEAEYDNETIRQQEHNDRSLQTPVDMFRIFIEHLGPSMNSLALTLKEILSDLPYGPGPDYEVFFHPGFHAKLDNALRVFRRSRNEALNMIYAHKDIGAARCTEHEADYEEVAASCGHFSFSLLEFGEQLRGFLEILDLLQTEVEARPVGKTWRWIYFWDSSNAHKLKPYTSPNVLNSLTRESVSTVRLPYRHGARPDRKRIQYRLFRFLSWFERDDSKYAIKVGIGAALYALPAFLSSTRPIYSHWRGEWGLLSYMIVCSMTIGASNTTGFSRFFGTSLGAVCALFAWEISNSNAIYLAILGWLMATWTSYIIVAQGKGPMGRFIMLTYNLIVLYAYSLVYYDSDGDEDEGGDNPIISDIALHRVVSVLTGIIWGIIITRFVWPISAREKLKDGLSLIWLWMGLIWKRDPLSTMTQGQPSSAYFSPQEKLELQRSLTSLESYCVAARSEWGLSPFPGSTYATLIARTQSLLDAFQTMNVEIIKNDTVSKGEAAMLQYTLPERMQVSSRISHLLTVLASSMKLEYPLNDVLPNIEHARDRLLARLHRFRKDISLSRHTTDEDYALLYAYTLVTTRITALHPVTVTVVAAAQAFAASPHAQQQPLLTTFTTAVTDTATTKRDTCIHTSGGIAMISLIAALAA
ncbi:hypothetical protein KEM54_001675 [Ascosphaera aggregata]|nr:hypothetical protein KEM54_001675 [Ascosphaera aggregata]